MIFFQFNFFVFVTVPVMSIVPYRRSVVVVGGGGGSSGWLWEMSLRVLIVKNNRKVNKGPHRSLLKFRVIRNEPKRSRSMQMNVVHMSVVLNELTGH